jgi:hypothetical protein
MIQSAIGRMLKYDFELIENIILVRCFTLNIVDRVVVGSIATCIMIMVREYT